MAIEGKILGVGDGKVDTLGGKQRKLVTRKEEKKNKVGDILAGENSGEREEFWQRSSELFG